MSVTSAVFFDAAKMPTPQAWDAAMRAQGFRTRLGTNFDPLTHDGFLPCAYDGVEAGFEYGRLSAAALLDDNEATEELRTRVGNRDAAVRFDTHSSMRELMTAVLASATLCLLTSGVLWELGSGEWCGADEVLARANAQRALITPLLE